MKLHSLLKGINPWMDSCGSCEDVLIGSLGRITRALPEHVFPGWSKLPDREALLDVLRPAVLAQRGFKTAYWADLAEMERHERKLLIERKLMSPSMAARGEGCMLAIPKKLDCSIMLNEEEHLVIHRFASGDALDDLRVGLESMAGAIEQACPFARSEAGDYLCSIPAECGNGLQMYLVLHLPGLVISNLMEEIRSALDKLNLDFAPFYSDGEKDTADLFVLFMRPTREALYDAEIAKMRRVAKTLVEREHQVRAKLLVLRSLELRDQISRALGRLLYATMLTFTEMANSFSLLLLGTYYGLIGWDTNANIHHELRRLNISFAPAHLCESFGFESGDMPASDIRAIRAGEVQRILSELKPRLLAI